MVVNDYPGSECRQKNGAKTLPGTLSFTTEKREVTNYSENQLVNSW